MSGMQYSYPSKLAAAEPDAYFHVIAVDEGYDPSLAHLKSIGVNAQHWASACDIPIVKTSGSASMGKKLSVVTDYLVRRGAQRPASPKTLRTSIQRSMPANLESEEVDSLIR